ncbi:MAG TPA: Eco57I restriction-modification methylase domain-containing protein [Syntrophobacter fumaroxidans]|nr:Eco57I restriction-modification methylase domain-containing protein [Syntrophobacter fumaroxidans]
MLQSFEHVDAIRRDVARKITQKRKSQLGQFMTPTSVARFMASLFSRSTVHTARLLDAGAGMGSLSGAFLDRFAAGGLGIQHLEIVAYEIDASLRNHLARTLAGYQGELAIDYSILPGDFIEEAVRLILEGSRSFSHAILNPPYRKINSGGLHRILLRRVGIETVNMYSAFVALTVELMQPGGEIVAIIPRSFCNGPYYRPFREVLFAKTAIMRMHLFGARDQAFKDDDVLQENLIIMLKRGGKQARVTITTSTDDRFTDTETHIYPFDQIVLPGDTERFIHVPTSPTQNHIEISPAIRSSLAEIGLDVSTGPVVDFRLRDHLRPMPEPGTVPLLYPAHFSGQSIYWPRIGIKKPNAILRNGQTEKWLYPSGCYVVVKRFSSKEEKRRLVATVVYPGAFNSPMLGLENHLNVFHYRRKGIPENVARGLSVFLNSTQVDEQFRRFSGHTQVNETDLRLLKYPSREALTSLGTWAKKQGDLTQDAIDQKIESLACQKSTP